MPGSMEVVLFVPDHYPGNGDFSFAGKIIKNLLAPLNRDFPEGIHFRFLSYERGIAAFRRLFPELGAPRITVESVEAFNAREDHGNCKLLIEVAAIHHYLKSLIKGKGQRFIDYLPGWQLDEEADRDTTFGFSQVIIESGDGRASAPIGVRPGKTLYIAVTKRVPHETMMDLTRLCDIAGGTGDQSLSELISRVGMSALVYEALPHKFNLARDLLRSLGDFDPTNHLHITMMWLLGLRQDHDGSFSTIYTHRNRRRGEIFDLINPTHQNIIISNFLASGRNLELICDVIARWRRMNLSDHLYHMMRHHLTVVHNSQDGVAPMPAYPIRAETRHVIHTVRYAFNTSLLYQCAAHSAARRMRQTSEQLAENEALFLRGLCTVLSVRDHHNSPHTARRPGISEGNALRIIGLLLRRGRNFGLPPTEADRRAGIAGLTVARIRSLPEGSEARLRHVLQAILPNFPVITQPSEKLFKNGLELLSLQG